MSSWHHDSIDLKNIGGQESNIEKNRIEKNNSFDLGSV